MIAEELITDLGGRVTIYRDRTEAIMPSFEAANKLYETLKTSGYIAEIYDEKVMYYRNIHHHRLADMKKHPQLHLLPRRV